MSVEDFCRRVATKLGQRYNIAMDGLSFTTFLKISLMPTTQGRLGTLQRMFNSSGGYDFYKRMKLAAREVALGSTAPQKVIDELSSIKKDAERQHNVLMAQRFWNWWSASDTFRAQPERPAGIYKTDGMLFKVRLNPELVHIDGTTKYVTYLWATNLPRLTKQAAGAGLFMLREELAKNEYREARFQILDLRQERMLGEECITNQSPNILNADIALVNSIWPSALPDAA